MTTFTARPKAPTPTIIFTAIVGNQVISTTGFETQGPI